MRGSNTFATDSTGGLRLRRHFDIPMDDCEYKSKRRADVDGNGLCLKFEVSPTQLADQDTSQDVKDTEPKAALFPECEEGKTQAKYARASWSAWCRDWHPDRMFRVRVIRIPLKHTEGYG